MHEPQETSKEDEFLQELEEGVRKIMKSTKSSKADKLAAIGMGVRLATIKHKISGGDDDKGFFK